MAIKHIAFENIPDRAFIPVVRKLDIIKAKILSSTEKKSLPKGSPDVQLQSPLGFTGMLSRNQVIKGYVHLNGRKIQMSGWKTGKDYFLMRNDNTPAVAMMVPLNYKISLGKKVGNHSNYLICMLDGKGNIDKSSVGLVSRGMFRKMFTILPNDIIDRHKANKNNTVHKRDVTDIPNRISIGEAPVKVVKPADKVVTAPKTVNSEPTPAKTISNQPATVSNRPSENKFTAVGRLLNAENKIVGFVIKDSKGMSKQVSKKEMLALCANKLVDNIVIATKEDTGTKYLRGNGIKIESLPSYNI